jgi:hypothetical protein
MSRKFRLVASTKSWAGTPLAAADSWTFSPCSSVPVWKKTRRPDSLMYRARTSHATLVYACPTCGLSLT